MKNLPVLYIIRGFFSFRNPELWSFFVGVQFTLIVIDVGSSNYNGMAIPIIGLLAAGFMYLYSVFVLLNESVDDNHNNFVEMGRIDVEDFAEFNKHLQELLVNKFPRTNPMINPTNVEPVDLQKPEGGQQ